MTVLRALDDPWRVLFRGIDRHGRPRGPPTVTRGQPPRRGTHEVTNFSAASVRGVPISGVAALGPWPQVMDNPVRDYDWGSLTALARLQGRAPSGRPEAELWMGAHPSAPSGLLDPAQTRDAAHRLDQLVLQRPVDLLGADVYERFGARLPFLLKILAISQPLSVQVHPTADRARAGYENEATVRGEHRYVDPYAKPELLYALEPVDAMCGFRTAERARALLAQLGGERMATLADRLSGDDGEGQRLEAAFEQLVTWPQDDRLELVTEVADAAGRLLAGAGPQLDDGPLHPDDRRALIWARRLCVQHPKDPLVAAPFLLDLVRLEPGSTLFVPAGAPHAYLHGLAVEIMGNSDNVLRAGLTHKQVAVEELLHIVHGGRRPEPGIPEQWVSPFEVIWSPGVPEFRLSRIWLSGSTPVSAYPQIAGPQIILCTAGTVRASCAGHQVELAPGASAFVGASGGPVTLTGPGEVFRAFAGLGRP
jgi:mannose-6-phosphate isomerase